MAEKHPDELELLSFVEGDLHEGPRLQLSEHLVACRSCADQVRRLEAGRSALRAAPVLELPADRREEIIASLPERRDPWRLFRPAKRVLVIAAPVAAAAALVGVLVLGGTQIGGGDDEEAGEAASDASAQEQAEGGQDEAAPEASTALGATLVRTVEGPPAAIVRLLEKKGITASIEPSGAVVAEGRAGDVRAALAGRPGGDVAVYVR